MHGFLNIDFMKVARSQKSVSLCQVFIASEAMAAFHSIVCYMYGVQTKGMSMQQVLKLYVFSHVTTDQKLAWDLLYHT